MHSPRCRPDWNGAALLGCLLAATSLTQGQPAARSEPATDPSQARNEQALRVNTLIARGQQAMAEKKWAEAAEAWRELAAAEPWRWQSHQALGNALLNLGQYAEAVRAYADGVAAARVQLSATAPGEPMQALKAGLGNMLTNQGNAYLKQRKSAEALAAYGQAAEWDPNPATAYFNLAATCYNLGRMEDVVGYADRAIAAGSVSADIYFIKGSALYGSGKLDKNNRYILPEGTLPALRKYLELAPNGAHAADVKAMLDAAGAGG